MADVQSRYHERVLALTDDLAMVVNGHPKDVTLYALLLVIKFLFHKSPTRNRPQSCTDLVRLIPFVLCDITPDSERVS